MVPGKLLYSLFPRLFVASHCSINRLAYQTLRLAKPELRLPRLITINHFEGLNGVDGLWLHNRQLPSRSTYNPITGQGKGLEEFEYQLRALQHAAQLKKYLRTAKRLAFVSHLITDLCTPPHQHGHVVDIREKRWFWFWSVRDDWYEKHMERYTVDQHLLFELSALWHLNQKTLPRLELQTDIMTTANTQAEWILAAIEKLRTSIAMIRQHNLYHDYVNRGWTNQLHQTMHTVVAPRIVSLVATFWYLALRPANGSATSDNPLIRR